MCNFHVPGRLYCLVVYVVMRNVSLEHKSSVSRWGVFIVIDKNTLYGSKLFFFFMPKIIRILSKDHVP